MNIHIVQHNIATNNPEENLKWILDELDSPESKSALLTVFPACTVCGSPLFGSVTYTDIQKRAQAVLQELIAQSEHRAFLIGMPLQLQDRGLCNTIVFVQNCAIRAIVSKKYLSPDEQKYFVRGEGAVWYLYFTYEIFAFKILFGSKADFTAFISSTFASGVSAKKKSLLLTPRPCSPEIRPPSFLA